MTRIEHLNHVMQKLKRKGLITPEEYETHNAEVTGAPHHETNKE